MVTGGQATLQYNTILQDFFDKVRECAGRAPALTGVLVVDDNIYNECYSAALYYGPKGTGPRAGRSPDLAALGLDVGLN